MQDEMTITDLEYLNAIQVTAEELLEYNEDVNVYGDLTDEGIDRPVRGYDDNDSLSLAMMIRLDALHELYHDGELAAWSDLGDGSGISTLHPAVFAAAATEALIDRNGLFVFDAGPFLRAVLFLSDTEGSA